MKNALLKLFLVALTVSSCATARFYAGFTPEAARQEMVLLGPVSNLYYLDRDHRESFSDSLSTASEELVAGLVSELGVPVSGRLELDAGQKEDAVAFMRHLLSQEPKLRSVIAIPSSMDGALEAQGCRYGLLLFAEGMTRDTKGYVKEAAAGLLLGLATAILTMGAVSVYSTPEAYESQVCAAVLDAQDDRVVFYNMSRPQERHPLRPGHVRRQLSSVLKDFLK